MVAQNHREREPYEGRLKARRELWTMESERRIAGTRGGVSPSVAGSDCFDAPCRASRI
jgi:hypothetical protein